MTSMRGRFASIPDDGDKLPSHQQALDRPYSRINRLQIFAPLNAGIQANTSPGDSFGSPDVSNEVFGHGHFQHLQFRHSRTSPYFLMGNKLPLGSGFHNENSHVTNSHGYGIAKISPRIFQIGVRA